MQLTVNRDASTSQATLGRLSVNGVFECFTCEDIVREIPGVPVEVWKVAGKTAIPAGAYRVIIDYSERFQRLLMHILDVPGFDGIRVHAGNTAADTHGCLLVGQAKTTTGVERSVLALNRLQPKVQAALDNGEEVTITINNSFVPIT